VHAFGNFFERETPAPQCQRLFDGIAHRITSSSVNSMTRLSCLFSIVVCSLMNEHDPAVPYDDALSKCLALTLLMVRSLITCG
jgi:hypothetical protein